MLAIKQPRRPNGFKDKSKAELDKLGAPDSSNSWPKFKDKFWQDLKPHFMKVQHKKCGYCEIQISSHGDVEHYRPKSVVQKLEQEGTEISPHSKKLRGRKTPEITEHGYWWLAYEWKNYLLACADCNQKYKIALFPVNPTRPLRNHPDFEAEDPKKSDIKKEKPLLINPFEKDLDPFEHFEFLRSGVIKARNGDPRGKETIRVCGLRRIILTQQRGPKAVEIWDDALEFLNPDLTEREFKKLAIDIYYAGHPVNYYPGMVRIIFKQVTFMEWQELEDLIIQEGWMPIVEEKVKTLLEIQNMQ